MTADAIMSQAEAIIREAVGLRRERGIKAALHEVAFAFGLSPQRVRAIYYGQLSGLWATEWEAIRTNYDAWCDSEAKKLEERAAILRARRSRPGVEKKCAGSI